MIRRMSRGCGGVRPGKRYGGERREGGGSVCSIWGWRVEVWGIRFE